MKYYIKFLLSLKEVFVVYFLQYIISVLGGAIYLLCGGSDINAFVLDFLPFILIGYYIIVIGLILAKKTKEKGSLKLKDIFVVIVFGLSVAIVFNMILFLSGVRYVKSDISLFAVVLSSGVFGPILEELVFRKIYLNKLLEFNSERNAVMINTVIFALIHGSASSMIYAFILGLFFNKIYLKYNNVWINIFMHMAANMVVIFLSGFNLYLFFASIIMLVLSCILVFRKLYN